MAGLCLFLFLIRENQNRIYMPPRFFLHLLPAQELDQLDW